MRKTRRGAERRRLGRQHAPAYAGAGETLYLVELPRAGLGDRRQGPPPRSHLDLADAGRSRFRHWHFKGLSRRRAAVRSCAGHGDDRSVSCGRYAARYDATITRGAPDAFIDDELEEIL